MGKTLSTNKGTLSKVKIENADVSAEYIDNVYLIGSGNSDKSWVFNNTYKAENHNTGNEKELWLVNYDEAIGHTGATISEYLVGEPGTLQSDKTPYLVWGAPEKFVYDVQQKYSNCGVDSALNILSMAGYVNVVEKGNGTEYQDYLDTPTKYKTDAFSQEKTPVYPKAAKLESEDEITLWALKNGYAISTTNKEYYVNGDSIYFEDGGTYVNASQYQEWWGSIQKSTCDIIKDYSNNKVIANAQTLDIFIWPDEKEEEEEETPAPEGEEGEEAEEEPELFISNNNKYSWTKTLLDAIQDGEGVIVSGNAYALLKEEEGFGGHAMTVVGAVTGTTKISEDVAFYDDIQGFFVVDTGGWLGKQGPAYISVETLYDFLTARDVREGEVKARWMSDYYEKRTFTYTDEKGHVQTVEVEGAEYDSSFVCSEGHIKQWADELNLEGNDQKNFLYGNHSNNILRGGKSDDVLYGRNGNDQLYGDADNDTLFGGQGNDTLNGGSGNDTYVFRKSDGVCHDTIVLGSGKDTIYFSSEFDSDELFDTEGCAIQWDELQFFKNVNNDLIIKYDNGSGELSSITVKEYFKGDNASKLGYIKVDAINSSKGMTVREYFKACGLTDKGIKETGISEARLNTVVTAVTKREYLLAHGTSVKELGWYSDLNVTMPNMGIPEQSATFIQSQVIHYLPYEDRANNIKGSNLNDAIIGSSYNDTITGGAGQDTLTGGAGNDIIKGGADADVIYASTGSDKIYGEAGKNRIIYDATEYAHNGSDTIYSGKGEDVVVFEGIQSTDAKYARSGKDLIVYYDNNGNSVTITDYYKNGSSVKGFDFENQQGETSAFVSGATVVDSIKSTASTGGIGNDTLTGTSGSDVVNGGWGNDVIKAGNGNDTLIGGKGDDKLYGQAGDNTYVFNLADGNDTIYSSGSGTETILFRDAAGNPTFTTAEVAGFEYTKKGNDLILSYATGTDKDISKITISGYFKSKKAFKIDCTDGAYYLSNAHVIMEGLEGKKNKLTGSALADVIIGKELNDTIKGGAGNDTITGGEGNDVITGGAGHNVINYSKGDGNDTINLTKGEQLTINFNNGFTSFDELSFSVSGKDLVISYTAYDDSVQKLTLKKYAASDVTKVGNQSVGINIGGESYLLPLTDLGFYYNGFTSKKYSYTGKWLSETIDAREAAATNAKGRGVKVNAGAGNDTIYGSEHNDTINGGIGDDVIISNAGKNSIDGGDGNDRYFVLAHDPGSEQTTIIDKGAYGNDIVYLCDKLSGDKYDLWFNVARGVTSFSDAEIVVYKGDEINPYSNACVTMKGIEGLSKLSDTGVLLEDPTTVKAADWESLDTAKLAEAINTWFGGSGSRYFSTSEVLSDYSENGATARNELQQIFSNENASYDIWA